MNSRTISDCKDIEVYNCQLLHEDTSLSDPIILHFFGIVQKVKHVKEIYATYFTFRLAYQYIK